jgi:CRISPR-associated endonuclease Cas2
MVKNIRKHFFTKKRTLAKEILYYLLVGGVVMIALSNPYAVQRFIKQIKWELKKGKKGSKRRLQNAFHYLKSRGQLRVERRVNGATHLHLTAAGKQVAKQYGVFRIQSLKRPVRWDGLWHIVIFDISSKERFARDALRFMLKRLGFRQLQKSVWVTPFECRAEIESLKSFFNLSDTNIRLIITSDAGSMITYREHFNV